ncbi:MAG: DUF4832 domain-containing protein [Cytophagaceae bacterium]|nr:DUF4832 domain-containing protein [Cytophagaceae bacterium]
MKRFAIPFMMFILYTSAFSQEKDWKPQVYNPNVKRIEENPLKGLIPAFLTPISNFPHSMEFFYIALSDVMKGMNNFDWAPFESELNRVSSQGKQAIFRFYIDYPGRPTAIPQFLIDGGLKTYNYNDHGNNEISIAPNYKDSTLIKAFENFIFALGAKYDGDPRIAYITGGLYGFWGEWHNWPHNNWRLPAPYISRLLNAYKKAFTKTHVQLRDALATSDEKLKHAFGYHDDAFAAETLGPDNWHFWNEMKTAQLTENWKTHPMGGEIYPPVQSDGLWEHWPNKGGQDWETCVRTTHATWFMNHELFKNLAPSSIEYANAIRATKMLGYEFFVSQVNLPDTKTGSPLQMKVKIQNKGVAPIYYNWKIEVAVLQKKKATVIGTADWNLTEILPDSTEYIREFSISHNLQPGAYKLLFRVVNPLETINKGARQLRFANEKQDLDKKGWLTAGDFEVK